MGLGQPHEVTYAGIPQPVEMYFEVRVRQAETIHYRDDYWAGHASGKANKLKAIRIGFATRACGVLASYPVVPTPGWYFQPGWGWTLMKFSQGLSGGSGRSQGWIEAGQHPDQPAAASTPQKKRVGHALSP